MEADLSSTIWRSPDRSSRRARFLRHLPDCSLVRVSVVGKMENQWPKDTYVRPPSKRRRTAVFPLTHASQSSGKLSSCSDFRREQLAQFAGEMPHNCASYTGESGLATAAALKEVHELVKIGALCALDDIELALMRIRVGKYGRCRNCDVDIPLAVLESIPQSTLCLSCSRSCSHRPRRHLPRRDSLKESDCNPGRAPNDEPTATA